jgi:hypothetical protein
MLDVNYDNLATLVQDAAFSTYGNPNNTYTSSSSNPIRIDFLMFWARAGIVMSTKELLKNG